MNQTEMTHRRRRSGAGFFGLTRFECPLNLDKNDPYYNDCFNQGFFIGSSGGINYDVTVELQNKILYDAVVL